MAKKGPLASWPLIIILFAAALVWGYYRAEQQAPEVIDMREVPAEIAAALMQSPKVLQPFTLTDHEGAPFTLDDLLGKWTLLFFGYTHCPDVCPAAMGAAAGAWRRLAEADSPFLAEAQTVFVSIDPQRDTVALLKEFIPFFHPDFRGLTGSPEAVQVLAGQLGVMSEAHPADEAGLYVVDHTAALFLINPQGRLVALFNPPHQPDELAAALTRIQAFFQENAPS